MYNFFMLNTQEIFNKNKIREKIIGYIFSYELLNKKLDSIDAFELWDFGGAELKIIDKIAKNYVVFKKLILSFSKKSWTWKRISPLNRSTLLYGTFEMTFEKKPIVIDALVKYIKEYSPDDSYKYINSILEKIGTYYEEIKNNQK